VIEVPWFEDFQVGDDFSNVPSVTITEGMTALHQAMFGDRQRLPLDYELCRKVTGSDRALVNPSLVCNLAIGQTTIPSQRVMGNLFYRGLVLLKPVFVGDTLTTTTKVVGLRQNKIKPGRAASGMVALEIHTRNQHGDTVLLFWRCPMIPCRDPDADTGHADDFSVMPEEISDDALLAAVPDWNYQALNHLMPTEVKIGQAIEIESRDTVTLAPELVRLTQNLAMTHTDAERSVYGKRLVYGGHTITMAAAQLARLYPNLLSILGWFKCDHTAPVFEQDILFTRCTAKSSLQHGDAEVLKLHVETFANRGAEAPKQESGVKVLDWSLAALVV
jgi:acyl dehydratase